MRFTGWITKAGLLAPSLLLSAWGCSKEKERPPIYRPAAGGSDAGDEPTPAGGASSDPNPCEEIPEANEEDACDSATVNLLVNKPTIYFVVDTSGSMSDRVVSGSETKIRAARSALLSVVEEVGHRIKYGVASFPGPALDLDELEELELAIGCEPGEEVFEIQEGDEKQCANLPAKGPVYEEFAEVVGKMRAEGGTPLAPTLDLIAPSLLRNEGSTTLVLLTDGSPNCGSDVECGPELCPYTDVGVQLHFDGDYRECTEEFNCCSDEHATEEFPYPSASCVDGPGSVEQVEALRAAGIDTYVIGLLGDFDFDDIMNQLAKAGGRPRSTDRAYYDVESLAELTDVVRAIGTKVAQDCTIELKDRPAVANSLNVYFDGVVLPFDPKQGWTIKDGTVTLHGDACDTLKSGKVAQVKLISGCETIIR